MNIHNELILQALEDYMKIEKPGYAVLVKGPWGCGKSFLINNWVDKLNKEQAYSDSKPVYVTLYGLANTKQIDEAVMREISPLLHGDMAKKLGKWAKVIASATIRYNLDIDGDGNQDEIVCTIDPKMLLGEDNGQVKTKRLLVFDDIERSRMNKKDVMGYINYYVEHLGCHVVAIGDEGKMMSKSYLDIKEKTIGKEFKVKPDTEQALNSFIEKIDSNGCFKLKERKQLIMNCFITTGLENLRVLKQSMEDYCMLVNRLPEDIKSMETFDKVSQNLLGNFVAAYAEVKAGNKKVANFNENLVDEIELGDNITIQKPKDFRSLFAVMDKYNRFNLFDEYHVMESNYVEFVIKLLLEGDVNLDFLQAEVNRDLKSPWELLGNFRSLENPEFKKCLGETAAHLENADFEKVDFMLLAACNMLVIIHKGLTYDYSVDKVIEWCKEGLRKKFFNGFKSYDELYKEKEHTHRCMGYYGGKTAKEELKKLGKAIEEVFKERASNLKNELAILLESLSDTNLQKLLATYGSSVPDHSVMYSQSAIFAQVEPEKFVNSFVRLKNDSKIQVIRLIRSHYHEALDIPNVDNFIRYYQEDLNTLPDIINLLEQQKESCQLVDRENVVLLIETLEEASQKMKDVLSQPKGV